MDNYLVVGNPIEHSLSPQIHAAFAVQTGQDVQYEKALVPVDGFAAFVDRFVAAGGKGLNVTLPFKLDAFAYVSERDALAQTAQAVNTIKVDGERVCGFNTDGVGLCRDLTQRLRLQLDGARILLLGAGGAARGIMQPLLQAGPRRITIANRTTAKAQALAAAFAPLAGEAEITAVGLDGVTDTADIILNSTSAGLSGGTVELPKGTYEGAFCYDLAYGPAAVFGAGSMAHGAAGASDGLGMLVEQAAESFSIWRGVRPQTRLVYAALREQVDAKAQDVNG